MNKNERKVAYYPIIKQYLNNKLQGWSIDDFFNLYGYKKIAYYAITEMMELVLMDVRHSGFSGDTFVYDTYYALEKYMDYEVGNKDKLINDIFNEKVDIVIVCSLFHENEIIDDLVANGVPLEKIVSIVSVIFSKG